MDGLQSDPGRRYWIKEYSAEGDIGDMGKNGTDSDRSQNRLSDVPQCLDNRRGVPTMKGNRLKVEIAQQALSDLPLTFRTLTIVHQALLPAKML